VTTLATAVTERVLQDTIIRMARLLGWRVFHPYESRRSTPGYPDLTLCHPVHGVAWIECKREKGRIRPEQHEWLDALTEAGARAFVARPSDMDRVEAILRGETI
jgi:hypothetical protein